MDEGKKRGRTKDGVFVSVRRGPRFFGIREVFVKLPVGQAGMAGGQRQGTRLDGWLDATPRRHGGDLREHVLLITLAVRRHQTLPLAGRETARGRASVARVGAYGKSATAPEADLISPAARDRGARIVAWSVHDAHAGGN